MHKLRILVVSLLLTSLAIAPALAKRYACENFSEKGEQREGRFEQIKENLELTEQQAAEINEIIASNKEKNEVLREEKRATREAIREMSRAETLDESQLRALLRKQADQKADRMIEKHATRARINEVLTPEQQDKHAALRQQRYEQRGSSKGRHKTR